MAYFDNAATTFPKPECVYLAMDEFYRHSGGNAGRGEYAIAKGSAQLIRETRELLQDILHCPTKQVVFTPSATLAMNMILQGLILSKKANIYVSPFEHNAVTRILHHFEQNGKVRVFDLSVSQNLEYDMERIRYQFDDNKPDIVVVSHVSNVIGLVSPIDSIFSLSKKYGAVTVVDMAQSAGLIDYNVGSSNVDFAVFAGHKTLYGPTGISGFIMDPSINLPAVIFGGTGYDSANQEMPEALPEKYEMGTLNILGVAGLNASLKWIKSVTISKLLQKENENRERLLEILQNYDFIKVIGNVPGKEYAGIVSCIIEGISSDSAGGIFDQCNISVRTGLHCAPKAHAFLKTLPAGTVRFSVNYFTSDEDFEQLQEALDYIEENS